MLCPTRLRCLQRGTVTLKMAERPCPVTSAQRSAPPACLCDAGGSVTTSPSCCSAPGLAHAPASRDTPAPRAPGPDPVDGRLPRACQLPTGPFRGSSRSGLRPLHGPLDDERLWRLAPAGPGAPGHGTRWPIAGAALPILICWHPGTACLSVSTPGVPSHPPRAACTDGELPSLGTAPA